MIEFHKVAGFMGEDSILEVVRVCKVLDKRVVCMSRRLRSVRTPVSSKSGINWRRRG